MQSHPATNRVMSPPPVYPQDPQPLAPQVNAHLGAGGPQAIPNPHLQADVHPQYATHPQEAQAQHMPAEKPQLRATPIAALNRGTAPVCCPACGVVGLTAISYHSGSATQ